MAGDETRAEGEAHAAQHAFHVLCLGRGIRCLAEQSKSHRLSKEKMTGELRTPGDCRDVELAKFEAFLKKEDAKEISALVRGSQHLAYSMKGCSADCCRHACNAFLQHD